MPVPVLPVPPRRGAAARVGLVLLRILLVLVPLVTIGILAWVPLLRVAAVRRRTGDWVLLTATAAVCTAAFVLQGSVDDLDSWQTNVGMGVLLALALACPVYFLFAELRPPAPAVATTPPFWQPAPMYWPQAPTAPSPLMPPLMPPLVPPLVPLGQVQAELDELSALLREQHRPS